jgi:glutamyl/glutaminyl-tRNA synthetase
VLGLIQERLKSFNEIPELTIFFFKDLPINKELISGNKLLGKLSSEELKALLTKSREELEKSEFSVQALTDCLNNLLAQTSQKPGILFSLIRIAITQAPSSPSLSVLGKDKSLAQIDQMLASL